MRTFDGDVLYSHPPDRPDLPSALIHLASRTDASVVHLQHPFHIAGMYLQEPACLTLDENILFFNPLGKRMDPARPSDGVDVCEPDEPRMRVSAEVVRDNIIQQSRLRRLYAAGDMDAYNYELHGSMVFGEDVEAEAALQRAQLPQWAAWSAATADAEAEEAERAVEAVAEAAQERHAAAAMRDAVRHGDGGYDHGFDDFDDEF